MAVDLTSELDKALRSLARLHRLQSAEEASPPAASSLLSSSPPPPPGRRLGAGDVGGGDDGWSRPAPVGADIWAPLESDWALMSRRRPHADAWLDAAAAPQLPVAVSFFFFF